jgi:hypothetical protein
MTTKRPTFHQWYSTLPVDCQPQFTDMLNGYGNKYRIVYSVAPELWQLADYVVSSRIGDVVYLSPREPQPEAPREPQPEAPREPQPEAPQFYACNLIGGAGLGSYPLTDPLRELLARLAPQAIHGAVRIYLGSRCIAQRMRDGHIWLAAEYC